LKWGVQRYHIRTRRELPGILLYSRLDIPYGSDGLYRTETVICVDGENVLKENHFFTVSVPGEDSNSLLEERKIQKREVKREAYKALSKFTGKSMPWGMLTGIRPAKIVHELMDKGCSKEEINSTLKEYYFVSDKSQRFYTTLPKKKGIYWITVNRTWWEFTLAFLSAPPAAFTALLLPIR